MLREDIEPVFVPLKTHISRKAAKTQSLFAVFLGGFAALREEEK
jgi:hypothetical protein